MRKSLQTVMFVVAAAVRSAVPVSAQEAAPHRFFLLGDNQALNLQAELRFKIGYDGFGFDSLSAGGTRAIGWTESGKLRKRLKEFGPDIVLVCFGTNEAKFDTAPSKLAMQFQSLVNAVSDKGRRRVVWIAPPALTGVAYLANVREGLKLVKGIDIVDLSSREYAVNASGIHLTRAAYRVWAWDIWAEILPTVTVAAR